MHYGDVGCTLHKEIRNHTPKRSFKDLIMAGVLHHLTLRRGGLPTIDEEKNLWQVAKARGQKLCLLPFDTRALQPALL